MKKFDIPEFYRSPIISMIKKMRKEADKRKENFEPTSLDFGPVRFLIARHFGFCYGVENAIEIVYQTINEYPDRQIYLLSEMIHNPHVNKDLKERGVQFVQNTDGTQIIPWSQINDRDIVVIPAFGTSIDIENTLLEKGIDIKKFNTTCPFVERVWKRSKKLGETDHTIIIHGKPGHEETRATFSHSSQHAPSLVIKDLEEAKILSTFIQGNRSWSEFDNYFDGRYSKGFTAEKHLQKLGVVNQTTMLATETQEIADTIGAAIIDQNGEDAYADTKDTLCYATSDNQQAVFGLLEEKSDLAIVVGGYNSSNTSHLVELCEDKLTTYHISGPDEIISANEIHHYKFRDHTKVITNNFLAISEPVTISLTSGASCPDSTVNQVIERILSFFPNVKEISEVINKEN